MDRYIGFKLIQAEPALRVTRYPVGGEEIVKNVPATDPVPNDANIEEGYEVVYPDGYTSWSPKEVLEKAYMKIGYNITVTQEMVDGFIDHVEVTTMGDKTTVVRATLVNGFIIVESSSCVDPANYNQALGQEYCEARIKNKVWELLGFLLQTARYGIRRD